MSSQKPDVDASRTANASTTPAPEQNFDAEHPVPPAKTDTSRRMTPEVRRLFYFFALAYFAQGMGQEGGLWSQPLDYYFKNGLHLTADDLAQRTAILILPWSIKPLYGLLSDLFPIAGSRRRSYLMLMSSVAILGFAALIFLNAPNLIVAALFLTALGIAFGDVLVDALMVENGQRTGFLRAFQGVQWQWIYISSIIASPIAGWLCTKMGGRNALHLSAFLTIPFLVALIVAAWRGVREESVTLSREEVLRSARGLFSALKSRTLWKVALIIGLINFSPSFGTPYYYYETDRLHFGQDFIGWEGAVGSVGAALGAFLFTKVLADRLSPRGLLRNIVATLVVSTLCYLLIRNQATALIVAFFTGILATLANLGQLSLAGEACPKRAEGFTFAALMSCLNLAAKGSDIVGSKLYEVVLHRQFAPLVFLSAGTTLLTLLMLPLLPKGALTPDE